MPGGDGVATSAGGAGSESSSEGIALDGNGPYNGGSQRSPDQDTYGDKLGGIPSPAPRSRPYRNATVRHDGTPRLLKLAGQRAVEFPFVVTKPVTCPAVWVSARAEVLIDGGRETDPPAEADLPEVLQWRAWASGATSRDPNLRVTEDDASHWSVIVSQPSDAAVTVSLFVLPVDRP